MFPAIDRRPAPCRSIHCGSIPGSPIFPARDDSPNRPGGHVFLRQGVRTAARARRIARAGRALLALCGAAAILIGCPLYSDECDSRNDCASGFYCDQFSRQCEPILDVIGCTRPSQCDAGETCTPDSVCRPGSCDYHGCVRGYRCGVVDFAHTCVPAIDEDASLPPPADAGVADGGGELDLDAGTRFDASDAALDAGP